MIPFKSGFFAPFIRHLSETGPLDIAGTGTPEAAVTAPVGSTYRRSDGGANTTLYRKESGAGNTGWVAVSNSGGSVSPSEVSIDFGSVGVFGKTGTVALAGAVIGEKVMMLAAPDGVSVDDEAEMDGFSCTAKITVTDLLAYSLMAIPGPVRGIRKFNLIKG